MRDSISTAWLLTRSGPWLALLIARALRHPGITPGTKSRLLVAGLYVCSPVDLVPELLLGGFGFTDDGMLIVQLMDRLLNQEDRFVVNNLWGGNLEDLDNLRNSFRRWSAVIERWFRPAASAVASRVFFGGRASGHSG